MESKQLIVILSEHGSDTSFYEPARLCITLRPKRNRWAFAVLEESEFVIDTMEEKDYDIFAERAAGYASTWDADLEIVASKDDYIFEEEQDD